jgi:hypothetical protein
MASNIVKMILKLDDKASGPLRNTGAAATGASTKFNKMGKAAMTGAAAMAAIGAAAVAGYRSILAMGQAAADLTNQFGDAATVTGLSAETLENFDFMARATGSSLSNLERGFNKFHQSISEARTGTGEMVDIFERLGDKTGFQIDAFENTEDALFGFLGALEQTNDEQFQAEAMASAFGRAAIDLNKALSTGDMDDYNSVLNEVGRVTGPNAIASTQEMQRAIALQEIVFRRMKMTIFDTFMGENGFTNIIANAMGVLTGFGHLLEDIWQILNGYIDTIINAYAAMYYLAQGNLEEANYYAQEAKDSAAEFATGLTDLVTLDWWEEGMAATSSFKAQLSTLRGEAEDTMVGQDALANAVSQLASAQTGASSSAEDMEEVYADMYDRMDERHDQTVQLRDAILRLNMTAGDAGSMLDSWMGPGGGLGEYSAISDAFVSWEQNLNALASTIEGLQGYDNLADMIFGSAEDWRDAQQNLGRNLTSASYDFRRYVDENAAYANLEGEMSFLTPPPGWERIWPEFMLTVQDGVVSFTDINNEIMDFFENIGSSSKELQEAGGLLAKSAFDSAQAVLDEGSLSFDNIFDAGIEIEQIESSLSSYNAEQERLAERLQEQALAMFQIQLAISKIADQVGRGEISLYVGRSMIDELADAGSRLTSDMADGMKALEDVRVQIDTGEVTVDGLKARRAEIEDIEARHADIGNIISEAAGIGQSLAGGDIAGAAGSIATLAGASPIAGGIITAIGAVAEIGQMTVKEIKSNARDFVTNLTTGFEVLAKALPDIIVMLLKNLPAVLIEAAFTWIPQLLMDLPLALMEGFVEGFKNVMHLLGEAIRNAFSLRDDDKRWSWGAVQPEEYATGVASVNRTGLAVLHRGETVITNGGRASQTQYARNGGAGGVNINISAAILDRDVIPRLVREIDRVTGNYGRTKANFASS